MSDEHCNENHARVDEVSLGDAHVQRMLQHDLKLTRQTYLRLRFGDDMPEPWTYQHEMSLPPIFRDTNAFFARQALQGLGNAIGVTYLGEMPK